MNLKRLEVNGFKSFAKKTELIFDAPVSAIVGPNGSGKSNIAEAFRWTLGEQSMKSLRGRKGEDLIFSGSGKAGRMNRASVTLVFDNSNKQFDVDFPEVAIERVVYRDGTNEYSINGSKVRLRDIIELLSRVSLGASSHHIISQNEADRILGASLKDRRGMIEDALGLRIYHWKIEESEKKLAKTKDNIKEAQSLRREIGGHLRFLQKEAEKIEKARTLKSELFDLYTTFFTKEGAYITKTKRDLEEDQEKPRKEVEELEKKIEELDKKRGERGNKEAGEEQLGIEKSLHELRSKKDELSRHSGRLEGIIELKEKEAQSPREESGEKMLPVVNVGIFIDELDRIIEDAKTSATLDEAVSFLEEIRFALLSFREENLDSDAETVERAVDDELEKLKQEKENLEDDIANIEVSEKELLDRLESLKSELSKNAQERMKKEREYFEAKEHRNKLAGEIEDLKKRHDAVCVRERDSEYELNEAGRIHGEEKKRELEILFKRGEGKPWDKDNPSEALKKDIERSKIRIEEIGPAGDSALHEYEEIKTRDEFLEKEIEDLQNSEESLKQVIKDLEERLEKEFKGGIENINTQFQKFFELMFGGGKASLQFARIGKYRSDEELAELGGGEEEFEEGIDISVNLPRKKIRGLEMLSGGERALTSIALLFAMSQVNPPPFLVLDETDAALDEANSRKYGDMLENLAKHTQLIIITHNRETMSRAGVLYGVTMGSDGISKLLSVKFDEAVKIAK